MRKNRQPTALLRFGLTLMVMLLPLIAEAQVSDPSQYGGLLRYGEDQFPDSFDPVTSIQNMSNIRLMELMFESLLDEDEFGKYVPRLAAEMPAIRGKEVIFNLRSDVTWHDGTAFTSEDVKFTFDLLKNPQTVCDPYLKKLIDKFRVCQILGPYQVQFVLKEAVVNPQQLFTFKIIPRHIVAAAYLQKENPFVRNPVGSGPFHFVENISNVIKLEVANPGDGGRAYLDRIFMAYVPDPQRMLDLAKSPDGLEAVVEVRPSDIGDYISTGEFNIRQYNSLSFSYIGYNFQHPVLRIKQVRQALTLGIDRAKILQVHYYGKGQLISGPYPPASPYNNPEVKPDMQTYAPNLAKQLLDQANCVDSNGDGVRDYNGKALIFDLIIQTDGQRTTLLERAAVATQGYWNDLGIKINIKHMDSQAAQVAVFQKKNFDMIMAGWAFDAANDVSSLFQTGGYDNFISYSHPQVDSLINSIKNTNNPEEKRLLHHKLHRVFFDELPYTFLWTLDKNAAIKKKVYGTEDIHPFTFFKYIKKWYIPIDYR